MEQNSNQPNRSRDREALKWACETLDLEAENQAIKKKETRREAMASFFNNLKSNDFRADDGTPEAVEIIHGKPSGQIPAFVRGHQKDQFQQLDQIVEWFAIHLGEQDHQQLLASLSNQLSSFNSETTSENVKGYGKGIWAAARTVQSPVNEPNLAVKKILQALFFISTIRSTKRRGVRTQLVGKLKEEFSQDQLVAARKVVRENRETPNAVFHRPFLSLLTSDEELVENLQIRQPVSSGAQTVAYARNFGTKVSVQTQRQESGSSSWWLVLVLVSVVGLIVRVGGAVSRNSNSNRPFQINQPAKMPTLQFDPKLDADDPRSVESALKLMRALQGEDTNLPTLEEFTKLKKKAEEAERRIQARKDAQAGSSKPDRFKPARPGSFGDSKMSPEVRKAIQKARELQKRAREKKPGASISPPASDLPIDPFGVLDEETLQQQKAEASKKVEPVKKSRVATDHVAEPGTSNSNGSEVPRAKNSNNPATDSIARESPPPYDPLGALDERTRKRVELMKSSLAPLETVDKIMERQRADERFRSSQMEAFNKTMRQQQEFQNKILEDSRKRMDESRRRMKEMMRLPIVPSPDLRIPSRRQSPFDTNY